MWRVTDLRGCHLGSCAGTQQLRGLPCRAPPRRGASGLALRAAMVAEPRSVEVRAPDGSAAGTESLSLRVAEPEVANGLVHRYVVFLRQNMRRGTASTLTRAEVRGGGRKPYAQKGTGNARQGSRRTPLRPGGGVIFGPKPTDWTIKMNKKEKRLAMATALQSAAGSITVVDDVQASLPEAKTKLLAGALQRWGVPSDGHALLILNELSEPVKLASRNMPKLKVNSVMGLNAYDILRADRIVVEREALKHIQEFYGGAVRDGEDAPAEAVEAPAAVAEAAEAPAAGSEAPAEDAEAPVAAAEAPAEVAEAPAAAEEDAPGVA